MIFLCTALPPNMIATSVPKLADHSANVASRSTAMITDTTTNKIDNHNLGLFNTSIAPPFSHDNTLCKNCDGMNFFHCLAFFCLYLLKQQLM